MTRLRQAELLPMTACLSPAGRLAIGGCDVRDVVEEFGSPLYVYDEHTIRVMCREFTTEFSNAYSRSHVEYSSKALANPAITRIIAEGGLRMDVVTGGELAFARAAEFPPERLNFHGNNKSRAELEESLDIGIARITIDSFREIDVLDELARDRGMVQAVLLRVSPSVDPNTHRLTTTGILDSKFGFSIETGDAERAVTQALASRSLDVKGLHFHLGSPIYELEPYEEAIDYVLGFAARMQRRHGLQLQEFSPGGGMAIGYQRSLLPPAISEYAETIASAVRSGCDRYGIDEPDLVVEPGRAIVGRAGVAVYTIGSIKVIPDVRTYVSVDGGMGDNIRPALYGSRYEVVSVDRPLEEPGVEVTIAGKFCESGDVLARDVMIPRPEIGELIAVPACGAYSVPMASNYNMQPRPALVLVSDGTARVIRRRESYDDLLATSLV